MIGAAARGAGSAVVIRPDIQPGRRVLAVSDIHGNLPFLKGLLAKVKFSTADVLILVGDLFEKGKDSIGTLRFLAKLCKTHTVYPLCGNCDHIDQAFLKGGLGVDDALWPVYAWWGARSLPFQLGAELGVSQPESAAELPALRRALREKLPDECSFLMGLPHILEAGSYIFVHGGISREDRLEELDAYSCLKYDNFLGENLSFRHWVVVGHWPVTLYHKDYPCSAPILLPERRIACIDGGCVLKLDGQLNALLIPDIHGDPAGYAAYDGLPLYRALDPQEPSVDSFNIPWGDSEVEKLRQEGDRVWCRHLSTGRELWIPQSYLGIRRSDHKLHTEDTTDYCLPVSPGDILSLCTPCERGALMKKDGVTGWYFGRLEPIF